MKFIQHVKDNAPALLTGGAVLGVVSTAYLSAKAGIKSAHRLSEESPYLSLQERAKMCWKDYIPAAASGTVTIACIFGNSRVTGKRTAAAQAAFLISERAYSEYRDHVVEEIGAKKEAEIHDKIAEKRISLNPPAGEVVIPGSGDVLCCELMTGRYFASTMEKLRKGANDLNEMLLKRDRCALDDWYDIIGLQGTSYSGELGWFSDNLMELSFTSVMAERGIPCLAFEYNYTRPIYGSEMA